MIQKILHTPEGVRDIYNEECEKKLILENHLRQVLNSYGYRDIETPSFEFFDVFSREIGTIPSRELYKFFDREGNTLVLRPDFTPSIARAASKYFMDEDKPIRLSYLGNNFINHSSYQGRLKESTQLGAELIGEPSADADAEIIAMVIDTLLKAGLRDFQISIGQVQFFEALVKEAGLDEQTEEELRQLIINKNSFGVEKLLSKESTNDELKKIITALPSLFGGEEVLQRALELTRFQNDTGASTAVTENKKCTAASDTSATDKERTEPADKAAQAILRLQEVLDILKLYELDRYVSFDLGMLDSYMYYTGIIFRGYTYGSGDAVIKGGRYDQLLGHFGKDAAAIGFVVVINQLMNALSRQKIDILSEHSRYLILYQQDTRKDAIRKAMDYRRQGKYVELMKMEAGKSAKDYQSYAVSEKFSGVIDMEEA